MVRDGCQGHGASRGVVGGRGHGQRDRAGRFVTAFTCLDGPRLALAGTSPPYRRRTLHRKGFFGGSKHIWQRHWSTATGAPRRPRPRTRSRRSSSQATWGPTASSSTSGAAPTAASVDPPRCRRSPDGRVIRADDRRADLPASVPDPGRRPSTPASGCVVNIEIKNLPSTPTSTPTCAIADDVVALLAGAATSTIGAGVELPPADHRPGPGARPGDLDTGVLTLVDPLPVDGLARVGRARHDAIHPYDLTVDDDAGRRAAHEAGVGGQRLDGRRPRPDRGARRARRRRHRDQRARRRASGPASHLDRRRPARPGQVGGDHQAQGVGPVLERERSSAWPRKSPSTW